MQIHEITKSNLDEGIFDTIKAGIAGAKQGFQVSQTNRATSTVANKVSQIWSNYAQRLKTATPDPNRYATLYQQALTAFVQKNLLSNQPISSATNKLEINQLISDITASRDNPAQVTQLLNKLVQQASLSQQDVTTSSLVKVISTNPTVIQYRNVDYAQNANGDWTNQKTHKVPDESFQAFMDQEAKKAGA